MDAKRAARIEALKHTPAWQELAEELEAADERSWKRLLNDQKQGKQVPENVIAELRGASTAIRVLLKQPEKAARILARENERKEADA